jgi:hypothetical protein
MLSLSLQRRPIARLALLALAALMVFTFSIRPPAQAETAGQRSTRNIILAGVALTTAIILYNNYHHKQVAHDTVVGRTADGGTVYADGRIVYPNGTVVYTSNDGRSPCTYDGYGVPCGQGARPYRVARSYDYDDHPRYVDYDDHPRPVSYAPRPRYVDYDDHQRPVSYAPRPRYVDYDHPRSVDRDDRNRNARTVANPGNHYGWRNHERVAQGNQR